MNAQTPTEHLINELQSHGVRLVNPKAGVESRRGGAGPSDHKAITIDGITVMVPVHTAPAFESPYLAEAPDTAGNSRITRDGTALGTISFPRRPRFYDLTTADGVPYSKIAVLHGRDVLATTVLQTCIRYQSRTKTCQFCAIGQSLAAGRTVERKSPAQLAEVAKAAVELDDVKHMVLTTGTPPGNDRGAAILIESAQAIKAAVNLPIQGQCEPPDDDAWFARMHDAGIDTLGMHLESVTPSVRARIMPGKASVPLSRYFDAFAAAVPVFGRGQVSTYILAGLGDTAEAILQTAEKLIELGVYPFVVPFVPISGTPLESHPAPTAAFMDSILRPLSNMLRDKRMLAIDIKAGCGKCGACSALSTYERRLAT
jgi:radical SAM protein (TIGR04043 family)